MPDLCTTPPDFTLPIYDSVDSFTLSSHPDKVILLYFMSLNCSSCWSWWDRWNALQTDFAPSGNVEIVVVMFNTGADTITDAIIDDQLATRGKALPSFTLLKDSGSGGTVYMSWMIGLSGPTIGFPYAYLISRSHLIVDKWHRLSTANGDLISFNSSDSDDVENFIRHRIDDLLYDRPRWNTILALDYSGSMGNSVTVHGVTKPKIEFLKDAVDSWLRVWKDYALCGDKLGVVKFQSNVATDGLLQPILPGDTVEDVLDTLDATSTDGCTAMGAGIATGIDMLETEAIDPVDPHQRYMVLFTDGKQNRNPMVIVTADCGDGSCVWQPQIRHISADEASFFDWSFCGPDGGLSDYAGPLPRILFDNPMQTSIHTIGIGPPDSYAALLNVIANETSGEAYVEDEVWPNLEEFFLESLVENFRGSSLAVVTKSTGTLAAGDAETSHTFTLNRSVKKATILLSWLDESTPLTMKVYKEDEKLNLSNKLTNKPHKQMVTLPFPLYQPAIYHRSAIRLANAIFKGKASTNAIQAATSHIPWQSSPGHEVEAEGEFEIVIKRRFSDQNEEVPYNLIVLADDSCTEVDLRLPNQQCYTGDLIPLDIVVTEQKRPLQDVFSATIDITRPVNAFSNMVVNQMHTKKSRSKKSTKDALQGPYDEAVSALMADHKTATKLHKRKTDRLVLQPDYRPGTRGKVGQKGVFRERYATTQVAGHYLVRAHVRAISANCGVFERMVTKTILVLPRPSFEHSNVILTATALRKTLTIRLTPADKFGNLLGPGFANQLLLALNNEPSGQVKDNLDGSYEIKLKYHDKDNRVLSLWVGNERLVHEPIQKLVMKGKK